LEWGKREIYMQGFGGKIVKQKPTGRPRKILKSILKR
jgi:hypothetical protein